MIKNATVWRPYTQMQTALPSLEVVASEGTYLTLATGEKLLDATAAWWTSCHGFNHPHIVNAIQQQALQMPHIMMAGLLHPQAQRLSNRLAQLLPGDLEYIFFSESGSVAVEIAMKMALQYWLNQKENNRTRFVYFTDGYHGDTFFTMSVCDPINGYHRVFNPVLPQQYFQDLPHTDTLLVGFEKWLQEHAHSIAAVIIEPLVQGCGGMKMHSPGTLKSLGEICQRQGVLLIVDEIFTGFGRTGSLFAIEQAPIVPDIICLSKALTGGTLPLAVTVARTHVYEAFLDSGPEKILMHGTTFMGNALACAAANASLDLFERPGLFLKIAAIEKLLIDELSPLIAIHGVKEVRVKGAIGAIQLVRPLGAQLHWFQQQFIAAGIWCRPFNDVIYTTPAFSINPTDLLKITQTMNTLIREWSRLFY